jgi:hypothetical protein
MLKTTQHLGQVIRMSPEDLQNHVTRVRSYSEERREELVEQANIELRGFSRSIESLTCSYGNRRSVCKLIGTPYENPDCDLIKLAIIDYLLN